MGAGRFPELPPSLPRRGNVFTQASGRGLLTLAGWRIEGEFPDRPKLVAIVAPHTSNWDFVVGISVVFAMGLRVRFLGKHTLFKPPLGWLMRWLGGTPVVRDTPQGAVGDAAEMIAALVERDLPFYDAAISEAVVAALNRFARSVGLLDGTVAYEAVVAAQFRELWRG